MPGRTRAVKMDSAIVDHVKGCGISVKAEEIKDYDQDSVSPRPRQRQRKLSKKFWLKKKKKISAFS